MDLIHHHSISNLGEDIQAKLRKVSSELPKWSQNFLQLLCQDIKGLDINTAIVEIDGDIWSLVGKMNALILPKYGLTIEYDVEKRTFRLGLESGIKELRELIKRKGDDVLQRVDFINFSVNAKVAQSVEEFKNLLIELLAETVYIGAIPDEGDGINEEGQNSDTSTGSSNNGKSNSVLYFQTVSDLVDENGIETTIPHTVMKYFVNNPEKELSVKILRESDDFQCEYELSNSNLRSSIRKFNTLMEENSLDVKIVPVSEEEKSYKLIRLGINFAEAQSGVSADAALETPVHGSAVNTDEKITDGSEFVENIEGNPFEEGSQEAIWYNFLSPKRGRIIERGELENTKLLHELDTNTSTISYSYGFLNRGLQKKGQDLQIVCIDKKKPMRYVFGSPEEIKKVKEEYKGVKEEDGVESDSQSRGPEDHENRVNVEPKDPTTSSTTTAIGLNPRFEGLGKFSLEVSEGEYSGISEIVEFDSTNCSICGVSLTQNEFDFMVILYLEFSSGEESVDLGDVIKNYIENVDEETGIKNLQEIIESINSKMCTIGISIIYDKNTHDCDLKGFVFPENDTAGGSVRENIPDEIRDHSSDFRKEGAPKKIYSFLIKKENRNRIFNSKKIVEISGSTAAASHSIKALNKLLKKMGSTQKVINIAYGEYKLDLGVKDISGDVASSTSPEIRDENHDRRDSGNSSNPEGDETLVHQEENTFIHEGNILGIPQRFITGLQHPEIFDFENYSVDDIELEKDEFILCVIADQSGNKFQFDDIQDTCAVKGRLQGNGLIALKSQINKKFLDAGTKVSVELRDQSYVFETKNNKATAIKLLRYLEEKRGMLLLVSDIIKENGIIALEEYKKLHGPINSTNFISKRSPGCVLHRIGGRNDWIEVFYGTDEELETALKLKEETKPLIARTSEVGDTITGEPAASIEVDVQGEANGGENSEEDGEYTLKLLSEIFLADEQLELQGKYPDLKIDFGNQKIFNIGFPAVHFYLYITTLQSRGELLSIGYIHEKIGVGEYEEEDLYNLYSKCVSEIDDNIEAGLGKEKAGEYLIFEDEDKKAFMIPGGEKDYAGETLGTEVGADIAAVGKPGRTLGQSGVLTKADTIHDGHGEGELDAFKDIILPLKMIEQAQKEVSQKLDASEYKMGEVALGRECFTLLIVFLCNRGKKLSLRAVNAELGKDMESTPLLSARAALNNKTSKDFTFLNIRVLDNLYFINPEKAKDEKTRKVGEVDFAYSEEFNYVKINGTIYAELCDEGATNYFIQILKSSNLVVKYRQGLSGILQVINNALSHKTSLKVFGASSKHTAIMKTIGGEEIPKRIGSDTPGDTANQ